MNPRIISAHFDCDNWEEFSSEEAKNVALAGIHFYKKFNAWFFLTFFEPLTIVFTVIAIFGNAIPIQFSKTFATDGYWRDHPEEFLESKRQN